MVTLAVLAILTMVAAPVFRDLWRRHQVQAATDALGADLTYARHEAVQRAAYVSVCPSKTGQACSAQPEYGDGWMVYAYSAGVAGANRTYVPGESGFSRLRYTVPSGSVVVNATDAGVVTFGQQGQFKSTAERTGVAWRVCADDGADDSRQATATPAVPGAELTLTASGSLQRRRLMPGDGCVPPAP
jgi:type IV fimbrial biogenesis protein FimT